MPILTRRLVPAALGWALVFGGVPAAGATPAGTVRLSAGLRAGPAGGSGWQLRYASVRAGPGSLTSVVALTPKDAWAAGYTAPGPRSGPGALVMKWNGSFWSRVAIRHGLAFGPATVAASGPKNVWLFGSWIQRWDGSRWHRIPVVAGPAFGENSPVVLSATNVWMFGMTFTGRNGCVSTMWHWNGQRWRFWPIRRFCATAMAGSSWRNVWVVGTQTFETFTATPPVTAWRWGGRSWRAVPMPHPRTHHTLPEVVVGSARNVWISNNAADRSFPNQPSPGYALHWNGGGWISTPASGLALGDEGATTSAHAGLWLGPDADFSAGAWLDTTPGPGFNNEDGYLFQALARVPGSVTVWGVGQRAVGSGAARYPLIASDSSAP